MSFKFLTSKLEREFRLQDVVQKSNRDVTNQSAMLSYVSLFSSLGHCSAARFPRYWF